MVSVAIQHNRPLVVLLFFQIAILAFPAAVESSQREAEQGNVQFTAAEQQWIKAHPVVDFTGDPNWLPYEAFHEDGTCVGMVVDYLKVIERESGLKFNTVPANNWMESLRMATEGRVSVISGDAADVVLNRRFRPVDAYNRSPVVIVMDHRQHYVDRLEQIKDSKIAVIKGYGYTADLFKQYPDIKFIEVENIQEGLEGVSRRRYDALLASMALATYHIAELGIYNVRVVGQTPVNMQLTLFVTEDQPLLHSIINKSLRSISRGEAQDIAQRWIRSQYVEKTDYHLVVEVVIAALLIVAIVLLWNRRLQKEVRRRKRVEESLLESRLNLQEAQEIVHLGSWALDLEKNRLSWSDEVFRIFEIDPEEFAASYEAFIEAVHPDDRTLVDNTYARSIEKKTPYEVEHRLQMSDGRVKYVHEMGKTLFDEAGNPIRSVGTVLDITKRKEVEEALSISERQFRRLVEKSPDILYKYSAREGGIYYSPRVGDVLGYTPEYLLEHAMCWHDSIHPSDLARVDLAIEALFAGTGFDIEYRIQDIHGEWHWFHDRNMDIRRQGKDVIVEGLVMDITERKQAEDALKKSNDKFRALVETTHDFVWEITADGTYTYCSPQTIDILGYNPEELLGRRPFDLMPEEERERVEKVFTACVDQYGPINALLNINLAKDGREVILETSGRPFFNLDGKLQGYRGVDRDITERTQAEKDRQNSEKRLRALSNHLLLVREEEKERIAREIHDELGGQLTAIKLDADWLQEKLDNAPCETAARVADMADSVLATIRRIVTELRPTLLDDMGLRAALDWQLGEFEKRTGIECKFLDASCEYCSEWGKCANTVFSPQVSIVLFRIVQEALTNVSRYANASRVDLQCQVADKSVIFTIRDNGVGFDAAVIEKPSSHGIRGMFERAGSMGGSLQVISKRNVGTTIKISLPIDLHE